MKPVRILSKAGLAETACEDWRRLIVELGSFLPLVLFGDKKAKTRWRIELLDRLTIEGSKGKQSKSHSNPRREYYRENQFRQQESVLFRTDLRYIPLTAMQRIRVIVIFVHRFYMDNGPS
jgi:hypothetical protein